MRFTFAVAAWLGLAAAAIFLFRSEQQLNETRAAARSFDLHAREAAAMLSDVRASEEAYVAAGQGVAYWMQKVASAQDDASKMITSLAETATTPAAREAIAEASKAVSDFGAVDKRARDYVRSDEALMAADVIFTEAGQTIAGAARQIEAARLAEREAQDAAEASARKLEAAAAAGAAVFAGLVLTVVAARPRVATAVVEPPATVHSHEPTLRPDETLSLRDLRIDPPAAPIEPAAAPPPAPVAAPPLPLDETARLCTDLGRVRDENDLAALLGRAAEVLAAKGLIVWLRTADGVHLRAVLAHGYPHHVVAKMPDVLPSDENAAARAYSTGETQVVRGRAGGPDGALVVPLLSADGCVGALSVELRNTAEVSEAMQALATIVAAQLAAIVGGAQPSQTAEASAPRTAAI